ncbi:MAG: hypothetical protein IRZ15_15705 [Bryobacteraceae bacterium]|nr:hypothetical protein [Bryobacteraceae bacterium]
MGEDKPDELLARTPVPVWFRALAGLEVGVIGGVVMLIWFCLDSYIRREHFWKIPKLLAFAIYGDQVVRPGFGMPALAGMSLHLVTAGLLGVVFGVAVAWVSGRRRLAVLAIITAFGWYSVLQAGLWRHVSPLLPLYTAPSTILIGHLLYGLCLSRYPKRIERMHRAFTGGE